MKMTRFLVCVQYLGSNFSGWSKQKPSKTLPIGIESCLTQQLQKFLNNKFSNFSGSSRTDVGVNAIRNYFQVDIHQHELKSTLTPRQFQHGLNHYLSQYNLHILDCRIVPDTFNCRTNATSRTYMYRLLTTKENLKLQKQWLFQDINAWNVQKLDINEMRKAASHLIGIHDFTSFRNKSCQSLSSYREIWRLDIDQYSSNENSLIKDPFLLVSFISIFFCLLFYF